VDHSDDDFSTDELMLMMMMLVRLMRMDNDDEEDDVDVDVVLHLFTRKQEVYPHRRDIKTSSKNNETLSSWIGIVFIHYASYFL
jgi:hypothetical protein